MIRSVNLDALRNLRTGLPTKEETAKRRPEFAIGQSEVKLTFCLEISLFKA